MRAAPRAIAAVLLSDAISTTGTEMTAVALPWFVLVTTGSPARMAGVMSAEFVGAALLGVPSGAVARALGPRRTLLTADAFRAPLLALIPLLHWTGALHYSVLLVVGFLVGACFPAYTSAQRLVVAGVVGADEVRLTRVSGAMGAVNESASFAGPALGGLLVALLGPSWVLLIDATSYLFAVLLVLLWVPATDAVESAPSPMLAGLRWLRTDRVLRRQIAAVMVLEMGWTALMVTLPVAARHRYHGGASLAGWFVAAFGGGSVLGGLASSRAKRVESRMLVMVGLAAAGWLLVPRGPAWVVGVAVAAFGFCTGLFFPRLFTALTLRPPSPVRAQVMTAATTVMSLTGPLGFVAAGLILDGQSVGAAFLLVAAVTTLGALVSVTGDPLSPRVDVEAVASQKPDERESGLVG